MSKNLPTISLSGHIAAKFKKLNYKLNHFYTSLSWTITNKVPVSWHRIFVSFLLLKITGWNLPQLQFQKYGVLFSFLSYVGWEKCLKDGCNRPRFRKEYKIFDYCTRTHAEEHQQWMECFWSKDATGRGHCGRSSSHVSYTGSHQIREKSLAQSVDYGKFISFE